MPIAESQRSEVSLYKNFKSVVQFVYLFMPEAGSHIAKHVFEYSDVKVGNYGPNLVLD